MILKLKQNVKQPWGQFNRALNLSTADRFEAACCCCCFRGRADQEEEEGIELPNDLRHSSGTPLYPRPPLYLRPPPTAVPNVHAPLSATLCCHNYQKYCDIYPEVWSCSNVIDCVRHVSSSLATTTTHLLLSLWRSRHVLNLTTPPWGHTVDTTSR